MGITSFVGVMIGDRCRAVYVHWNGFLNGVGAELQHYTSQAEVEELISHGDRSSLTQGFYSERGEVRSHPVDYSTFKEFYHGCKKSGVEYYYIFKNGIWYCGDTYDTVNPTKITEKLVPYEQAITLSR